MIYTSRFAHLAETSLRPGQVIKRGDIIGIMGNTGASAGAHLHLDVVEKLQAGRYNLADIAMGRPMPSAKQCVYFVDDELFGIKPVVTTYYADPEYYHARAKLHCGFDLVPEDRHTSQKHFIIRWNRSMPGRVVKIIENDPGYGNCAQIAYEA